MFSLVLAFSGALAFQTPPDVSTLPPEQAAQVSKVFAGMTRMFETLGTCERQFPPGVADQIRASMANETDPAKKAATAFLLDAYDKGKASPRAATISSDECTAEMQAITAEMQALQTEIEAAAPES
ncbi:MAG: hypothetical protein U1C74_00175 [Phenylobacterium sp.]|jgi:hypothetical protein|uniref:Uncharacterized protein n=1 Tax=Brevundimonas mediterranea TaxID=74329 RepID=A0A6G7EFQ5_9CAUL|nr:MULTISPECIES: hypothetical protein [Brevundimonas]MBU4198184.1 hypothetical protein [Alphaproteobacteria bacterium]MDZ4052468.1 hypothetical protein [Phenylobacterium sp.]OYX81652.1 MAG: hypothetical protein B7Y85_00905 [Brevundimonas sp. 32-68-21]EDX81593.1 hypothetical protein BBAL3_2750 [Brevundimonas sp. BAL3]MBA4331897.1 hypothetical protein [Brevundimonas sp.]